MNTYLPNGQPLFRDSTAKTVILIDDDEDDIDMLKEVIREVDGSLVCMEFNYAEKALRFIFNELIFMPDYIFIDINMPRISGDKCLTELRKNATFDNAVIVMLSTSMPDEASEALKKLGANFAFEKPNKFDELHMIVKKVLTMPRFVPASKWHKHSGPSSNVW